MSRIVHLAFGYQQQFLQLDLELLLIQLHLYSRHHELAGEGIVKRACL